MSGWPTTRRFPRSLAEAYADERACAIYGPPVRSMNRIYRVLLATTLCIFGAITLLHWCLT